jgi:drug/metabolite transporter (DMT)-like permease
VLPLLALVAVTAVWGFTFVQVKDAVALYPLFAFLAVRFAISTAVLAPFAWRPLRGLPRRGLLAGCGAGSLLALAYGLQTAGLELTTVSSTGLITGLYVVFTPMLALLVWGTRVPAAAWGGVVLALGGLVLLNGTPGGSMAGNVLVLGNALAQSGQIVAMERFAPRYDPWALTFVQMAVSAVAFAAIAGMSGQVELPRGATVWAALLVTGIFAGALGYLVATWVQARAAVVFTLEAPFAALFGVLLAGDRLGAVGWIGCGLVLVAIFVAEPAAASVLRRLAPRRA